MGKLCLLVSVTSTSVCVPLEMETQAGLRCEHHAYNPARWPWCARTVETLPALGKRPVALGHQGIRGRHVN